jgi:bd-type cytochrome oxidase subunit I
MELTALLLSRLQFAFTISFHIIFPSFTIGLATWLPGIPVLPLCSGEREFSFFRLCSSIPQSVSRCLKARSEQGRGLISNLVPTISLPAVDQQSGISAG